jgi:hypothetical protein
MGWTRSVCRKHAAERRACDPTYSHLEASGVRFIRLPPRPRPFHRPPRRLLRQPRDGGLRPQRSVGYRAGDRLRDRADPATLSRSLFAVEVLLTSEPRQAIRGRMFRKARKPVVRATNTGFSLLHTRLRVHQTHGFPYALSLGGTRLTHRPGRLFALRARGSETDEPPVIIRRGPTSVLIHSHLSNFVSACSFARRLKPLKGLTPYEFVCKDMDKRTTRIHSQSAPANAGLYI